MWIKRPHSILLINPWIYDFTAYDFWLKPLGLLTMASLIKKHTDFQLSYIDCLDRYHPQFKEKLKTKPDGRGPFPKEEVSKPSLLKEVPRKYSRYGIPVSLFLHELNQVPRPEVVLLCCTMTYWYPGVQFVVELIRNKFGRVPVILGGIYATLMPEHARQATGADIIVEGAGEKKILPLIREILGDKSCPDYRYENLEEIPWPDFGLIRVRETLPLLTSRGCPFNCSFCASSLIHKEFEQRSPSSVAARIEYWNSQYSTKNIAFYDDALLINRERHILPLLQEIIRRKLPVAFHTPNGLHVREINLKLACLFKKAHFKSLFLSQESFEEKILEESCPKVGPGDLEIALAYLEEAGYDRQEINVYHMVGLPGQDVNGIKEGILYIRKLGAKPRLAYFSPVPGTGDWQKIVKRGYLKEDTDPLLHNKLVFPYIWGDISPEEFEGIRDLVHKPIEGGFCKKPD